MSPAGARHVAILPWGDVLEDYLDTAAITLDEFCNELTGGWLFGAWVGLVLGVKLVSVSLRRKRTDYEPDRGNCVACARCFEYCPNELVRRGVLPGLPLPVGSSALSPAPASRLIISPKTTAAGSERKGI